MQDIRLSTQVSNEDQSEKLSMLVPPAEIVAIGISEKDDGSKLELDVNEDSNPDI